MSIEEICEKYDITNYTINQDNSIDVDGNVYLSEMELTELPLKFNHVSGHFYCYYNNLTNLEGSPESVGGNFDCYNNNLTSLEGSPESVGDSFFCSDNNLTTLSGSPQSVGGGFVCSNNNLTNLESIPENIGGDFYCDNNPIGLISGKMDIDFIRAFNSLRVLKDKTINLKRLKYVMELFNKPVNLDKIEKYYQLI